MAMTMQNIKEYVARTVNNTNPNQIESMINAYAESSCKLFVVNLKTANPPVLDKKYSEIISAKDAEKTIIFRQTGEPDVLLSWDGTELKGTVVLSYSESAIKIRVITISEGEVADIARLTTNVIEVS